MLAVRTLRKDTNIVPTLWAEGTDGKLIFPIGPDQVMPKNTYFFLGILRGSGAMYKRCQALEYDFFYADHAYLFNDKYPKTSCYRITKNHHVNFNIFECKSDRYEMFKSKPILPWKNNGGKILILPPDYYMSLFTNSFDWLEKTVNTIKKYTDRKIIIRERPVPKEFYDQLPIKPKHIDGVEYSNNDLQNDLENAWSVVAFNSVISVESLGMGIPVFTNSTFCPAYNLSSHDLSSIEKPFYPENREELFMSLAYSQFTLDEIKNGYAHRTLIEQQNKIK